MRRAAAASPFLSCSRSWALPPQCLGGGDSGTMAPSTAVRQTCCCFNVRIATTALAIYHVVSVGRPGGPEGVCV